MSMNEIGVAIVGTGFMGWVHAEALRRVGVRVVGMLGSTAEKSRRAARELDLPKAYGTYEEVLADASVDSIHIVTPNRLHFGMARQAILASKHIMCEKPLAMTSDESGQLAQLASEHPHLATGVNYNIRFYPLCIEARQRVQQGEIGELFHVCGSYAQDWLLRETDYNWRVLTDEGGNLRAIADIGTHWLDLVQSITAVEVEAVCADLKTVHPVRSRPTGEVQTFATDRSHDTESIAIANEDYGCVMLRFRGGARGNFYVSQVTAGRKNCLRFEIAGSQQSMAWNSESPNELWLGHRDQANETLIRDPALLRGAARDAASLPGGHNEGHADSFKQGFRTFYTAIQSGKPSRFPAFPTFADGHREVLLCEAILASHKAGQWTTVGGDDLCNLDS